MIGLNWLKQNKKLQKLNFYFEPWRNILNYFSCYCKLGTALKCEGCKNHPFCTFSVSQSKQQRFSLRTRPPPPPWPSTGRSPARSVLAPNTSIGQRSLEPASYVAVCTRELNPPSILVKHECNIPPCSASSPPNPPAPPHWAEKRGIILGKSMVASGRLLTAAFATVVLLCSAFTLNGDEFITLSFCLNGIITNNVSAVS